MIVIKKEESGLYLYDDDSGPAEWTGAREQAKRFTRREAEREAQRLRSKPCFQSKYDAAHEVEVVEIERPPPVH